MAVWLVVIVKARHAYVAAYRQMLGAGELEGRAVTWPRCRRRTSGCARACSAELDKLGADDTLRRGKRLRAIARLTRKSGELELPPETIAAAARARGGRGAAAVAGAAGGGGVDGGVDDEAAAGERAARAPDRRR